MLDDALVTTSTIRLAYKTSRKTWKLPGAWTPHSLDAAKKVLRRHIQDEVQENSKTPSEVLGSLQYSTKKSPGACQTRVHGIAHMAYILQDKWWGMDHTLHQL
jgi:hypothetical protein